MLDLRFVRENIELVEESLRKRGNELSLDKFREMEEERRRILTDVEKLKHRRNVVSDQIGELKRKGEDTGEIIAEMKELSGKIKEYDERLKELENNINDILLVIPNIPHESVPVGSTDQDNEEVFRWGEPRNFSFTPKAHWELGEGLDILDFGRAAKVTGARFTFLKNAMPGWKEALSIPCWIYMLKTWL